LKTVFSVISILFVAIILAACQSEQSETIMLLDEKIAGVEISTSKGFGEMNENVRCPFTTRNLDHFRSGHFNST
jgi:hypothetical protein